MEIITTEKQGFQVVEFVGNLDTSTALAFEEKINQLIEDGELYFIFNFARTDYMSSSGLRVLLATAKKLKDNGVLRVSNLNTVIQEVFDVSGFITILDVYASEEEALA